MMEGMADRHVLSRNYTKWKVKYETEQKDGLASLHFKWVIPRNHWDYLPLSVYKVVLLAEKW